MRHGSHAEVLLALVLAAALAAPVAAQQPAYEVQTVATGLDHPWSIAFLPDGRMLVTERAGRLRIIDADGSLREAPVDGVPDVHTDGQAGLKEVALAPDFDDSGVLYLSYACGDSRENNTCLSRARLDGDRLADVTTIFTAQPMKSGDAHYGGRIAFLPDGTLVLTLGDGFDYREQAQDPSSHIGTIVRLNADGSAPGDNPFVGRDGHLPEILSYGHRNVQGVVHDRENDRLLVVEHGPRGGDELNVIEPGGNYGWPAVSFGIDYSGARITPFQTLPGFIPPVHHWTPSIAPAGLALYRGEAFGQWDGDLLVAALTEEKGVHRVRLSGGEFTVEERLLGELDERIRHVAVAPDGTIFALTDDEDGSVLRLVPADG